MDSKLQVPFVCQFIAMRWSYEELVVAQAKLNPLTRRQDRAQREIDRIVGQRQQDVAQSKRLEDLKETLAVLSGLGSEIRAELDRYLGFIDKILDGKRPFDRALFKDATGGVTAEQIYVNQKVSDLISNAEMEQSDYRRGGKPNVFFGAEKRYLGMKINVFVFNTIVLVGSAVGLLGLASLDFAPATGSAKERSRDETKKHEGTRLIVAAKRTRCQNMLERHTMPTCFTRRNSGRPIRLFFCSETANARWS